jgi:hypothetical protein
MPKRAEWTRAVSIEHTRAVEELTAALASAAVAGELHANTGLPSIRRTVRSDTGLSHRQARVPRLGLSRNCQA